MKKLNILVLAFAFGLLTTALVGGSTYATDGEPTASTPTVEASAVSTTNGEPATDTTTGAETGNSDPVEGGGDSDSNPATADSTITPADTPAALNNTDDTEAETTDEETVEEITEAEEVTFPICEALFQSYAGQTIKFGSLSGVGDDGNSSLASWAIYNVIDDAIASDLACTTELKLNNAYYSRSLVNRYTEDEDGNEGDFWTFSIVYRKEDGSYEVYESKRIPITAEEDTSEERAAIANDVIDSLNHNFIVTGDEIKKFNSISHDSYHFNPNNLAVIREVLDSYDSAEVTLTEDVYNVYSVSWGEDDAYYSGINLYVGVFVDGYFYGYASSLRIGYEAERIYTEDFSHNIVHPVEDDIPSDAIFTVTEQESSTAETVLLDGENLTIVYDFTLTATDGTPITQFPYGITVNLSFDSDSLDLDLPLYARYINADGRISESDIPVNVGYCWGSSPMSLSGGTNTGTYCANFIAHHFSRYAFIQTLNPVVITEENDAPDYPSSGYAEISDKTSSTVNFGLSMATAILLGGTALFLKKRRA